MLRSTIKTPVVRLARFQSTQTYKQVYTVPHLSNIESYKETGIPGLLSSQGLQNAFYKRAELYADNLNKAIYEESLRTDLDLKQLIRDYAKSGSKKKLFNNASLLNNITFAMSCLGTARGEVTSLPSSKPTLEESLLSTPNLSENIDNPPSQESLSKAIDAYFGSLIEFKTLLLNSAMAINGDGFTWLVVKKEKETLNIKNESFSNLFIMNTYNCGSPLNQIKAGQLTELQDYLTTESERKQQISASLPAVLTFEEANQSVFGRTEYKPLLAIDASPKNWLFDYGVYGKKQYLEQVWRCIDWEVIGNRATDLSSPASYDIMGSN